MNKTPFEHMTRETSALVMQLYKKMDDGDLDVDGAIEMYAREFPKTAAIRLLQDLENCRLSCENMYEEIKRVPPSEIDWGNKRETKQSDEIRRKYEALGLVQQGLLPETLLSELCGWALDKAAKCARATLQILSRYLPDVLSGLQLGPGVTVMVQAGATWKATVTVGLESTVTAQR